MRLALLVPLALAALAGCGMSEEQSGQPPAPPRQDSSAPARPQSSAPTRPARAPARPPSAPVHVAPACHAGEGRRLGSARTSYAAVALRPTRAFRRPGRDPFASFGRRNVNGHVTVFGVVGVVLSRACRPAWYRVQLPVRPNGSRGFVRAADLDIGRLHTRIVVDLSARRLTFYRSGRRVLSARAAVGADRTPTPTGRFYVDQRLIAADPAGPWGPGAIGISAHSDVLRSWAQGGPIAIHGTNAPWSLGRPVSNGCIRLDNRTLSRLFAETPAGTPVLIQA